MTKLQFERYYGLKTLHDKINNFEIGLHFPNQTDSNGTDEIHTNFLNELKELLVQHKKLIETRMDEI